MKLPASLPLLLCALVAGAAHADVISDLNPVPVTGLHGATSTDRWTGLNSANHPGYPGFPGSGAWPAPIVADGSSPGAATLNKTSGNAALLSTSVYFGAFTNIPQAYGGSLGATDSTPIASLKTVVFQLEIGQANGFDLWNGAAPTLTLNGGGASFNPVGTTIIKQAQNGTFTDPNNNPQPVYLTLYGYQYDLSAATAPISSYTVDFSGVQHSQVYAMQLDAGDVAEAGSVLPAPEPSAWAMIGATAVCGLAWSSRRHRREVRA